MPEKKIIIVKILKNFILRTYNIILYMYKIIQICVYRIIKKN